MNIGIVKGLGMGHVTNDPEFTEPRHYDVERDEFYIPVRWKEVPKGDKFDYVSTPALWERYSKALDLLEDALSEIRDYHDKHRNE